MMESDENLMSAVRDGDLKKLGILFDRHHRALFDYLSRMTGSPALADDLVQDVFFRMLKYRKTFRGESRFKSWMFHIARNVRFDHFRDHEGETPLNPEHADGLHSKSPIPGELLESGQDAEILRRALQRLTPEKREVLVLSRFHGMKYDEIAELAGCEVGTIKTRAHRAIGELREVFLELSNGKSICDVKKSEINFQIM